MRFFSGYEKKVHVCKYPGRDSSWYWMRVPAAGDIWRCRCGQRWEFRNPYPTVYLGAFERMTP